MSEIMALDIGTANGKAAVLSIDPQDPRAEHRDPTSLMPPAFERAGMPTDAFVLPDGTTVIAGGESVGHIRPNPADRVRLRSLKTALYQESLECTNRRGMHFRVATADVFASIVREMVVLANQQRTSRGEAPLYSFVLTVPSIFTEGERGKLIMDKVRAAIAGVELDGHHLTLVDTIPEAAAAAQDFLHFICYSPQQTQQRSSITGVVYDFGAGTFDTALVSVDGAKGTYQLYHHEGLPFGGRDIDNIVLEWFVAQIEEALAGVVPAAELEKLLTQAQHDDLLNNLACEVKEELSVQEEAEHDHIVAGHEVHLSLSRKQFCDMIAPDVNRTLEQLEVMLRFASEHNQKVDYIILTGGSSSIPYVQEQAAILGKRWGVAVETYRTTSAVSFGAARYAYRRHLLEKRTGYRYSVLLEKEGALHNVQQEIIPLGTVLPFEMKEPIELRSQFRGMFWLCRNVNPGDPADADLLEDHKRLMRFRVDLPMGSPFLATIGMDGEYQFTVSCQTPDHKPLDLT